MKGLHARLGILYLNNTGSRWVDREPGRMDFILVMPDGTTKQRRADFFEAFGNFFTICFRVNGRRYAALPKASDGSETRLNPGELPHVFMDKAARTGRFRTGRVS